MKAKKLVSMSLVAALAVSVFTGCGGTSSAAQTSQAAATDTSGSKLVGNASDEYYMVTFQSGIEFWKMCKEGFDDAGALYGVTTQFTGSEERDVEANIAVLEQVIAKQPKGIAIACVNADAYVEVINKAVDAGIGVVTFNADSPESKRYSFVGPDNYSGGETAAKTMAEQLNHKGKVAVIGVTGQSNHEDRANGFVDYIEANEPDMEVVQVGDGKGEETTSATAASGIMQANPDLAGFFTTSSSATVGVAGAIKENGNDIKLVGFDQNEAILDAVKEGTVTCSISQNNWQMGYWALHELYLLANDCLQTDWQAKGLAPLPNHMNTDFSVITKDNADAYYVTE